MGEDSPTKTRAVFESTRNASVYAYYIGACGENAMPRRQDIDPARMKAQLPYIYMVQVVRDESAPRFKFRLMGTELVNVLKQDGTGAFVRDLDLGGWEKEWRACLMYAAEAKVPVVALDKVTHESGLLVNVEHLAMPLSEDGDTVDRVFGALDFLGFRETGVEQALSEVNWSQLENVEVPKRLIITNLALPLE